MYTTRVSASEARVVTQEYRAYGRIHLAQNISTSMTLNNERKPYLPVTEVTLFTPSFRHPPAEGERLETSDFVVLPKARIDWLIGGAPDTVMQGVERQTRKVFLLFEGHAVTGELPVLPTVRISDFLVNAFEKRPFQSLYDADIRVSESGGSIQNQPPIETHEFITVNLRRVAGIFDVAQSRVIPVLNDY